jgi:hypothetical protein
MQTMADTIAPDMRWLPMAQAAQALGISPRTMQRRVLDGQIPAKGVGRHRVYLVAMAAQDPARPHEGAAGGIGAMSAIVSTLGATAAETRALAQTTLDDLGRWREQAARDRRSAARAWMVAAGIAAGLTGAIVAWRSEIAQRERADQEAQRARADAAQAVDRLGTAFAMVADLRAAIGSPATVAAIVSQDCPPDPAPSPDALAGAIDATDPAR